MDFDQAVFADITGIAVFSATGDAIGYANVTGRHVDAHFSSSSGGIGRSPSLPVFVVWLPVFVGAPAGTTTSITLDPSGSAWSDTQGNQYLVTVIPNQFTVGGTLSVRSVSPGGGPLPAGAVLQISGTGFDTATNVEIDGLTLASVKIVNGQQIQATLAEPAEMTGRGVRLSNSAGEQVSYYPALPSSPSNSTRAIPGVQPIVSLANHTTVTMPDNLVYQPFTTDGLALLNQNQTPVTVECVFKGRTPLQETITVPAGALYFLNVNSLVNPPGSAGGELWINASAPLRMLQYIYNLRPTIYGQPPQISVSDPAPATGAPPPLQLPVSSTDISWSWQIGTPQPAARSIDVAGDLDFTVSISTTGGAWLTVDPAQATAPASLKLTPNVSSSGPGTYSATVTITPAPPKGLPGLAVQTTQISVSLTISARPIIAVSGTAAFIVPVFGGPPMFNPQTVLVASNGDPASFTASVRPISGGNWLSVTPVRGTAPTVLTLTANTTGLAGGNYASELTIQGPANNVTIPVSLLVLGPPPPPSTTFAASPPGLSFFLQAGENSAANAQQVSVQPVGASITASVQTESGGEWLSAVVTANAPDPAALRVNANATNLAAGAYRGTVTIASPNYGTLQVPVTLTVWSPPPLGTAITISPASVALAAQAGQSSNTLSLRLDSGGVPVVFTVRGAPVRQAAYMAPDGRFLTPAELVVTGDARNLQPGVYRWDIVVDWANGSATATVTLTVTPGPSAPSPPLITSVVNAASQKSGALSPGEIVTIYGRALASGATTLTIGGVAAPLLYVSPTQLNATVPYEVGTGGTAAVQVQSDGLPSTSLDVPLAQSAPAVFSSGSTGQGQAAVLNQDNSVNVQSNPAARGSVIQIFATGEGQTSPPGVTGEITGLDMKTPLLPVSVTIGGLDALVEYKGSAPQSIAGFFQVNVVVPPDLRPGSALPLVLTVGEARSPDGVTVAVK